MALDYDGILSKPESVTYKRYKMVVTGLDQSRFILGLEREPGPQKHRAF